MVLWDAACNFNAIILNQSIFNCLITSASTLHVELILFYAVQVLAFLCILLVMVLRMVIVIFLLCMGGGGRK